MIDTQNVMHRNNQVLYGKIVMVPKIILRDSRYGGFYQYLLGP